MSKLDQMAGSKLRDALDASAQQRLSATKRLKVESLENQLERQEKAIDRREEVVERSVKVKREAAKVKDWLEQTSELRVIQAQLGAESRATSRAALHLEVSQRLEQHATDRVVGGAERAVQRRVQRQRTAETTQHLLADASSQRQAVQQDLQGFRQQLRRASSGASRVEIPVSSPARVSRKPVAAAKVAAPAAPVKPDVVGAMQSPDPMTSIARRREHMIIKMIAANPGITGQHLEKHLYMDRSELQAMLKRLVTTQILKHNDGSFWLLPRAES